MKTEPKFITAKYKKGDIVYKKMLLNFSDEKTKKWVACEITIINQYVLENKVCYTHHYVIGTDFAFESDIFKTKVEAQAECYKINNRGKR